MAPREKAYSTDNHTTEVKQKVVILSLSLSAISHNQICYLYLLVYNDINFQCNRSFSIGQGTTPT